MNHRPRFSKWKRRTGGVKICTNRSCKHPNRPVIKERGVTKRPKTCIKCGSALPSQLTYPKKAGVVWYVREHDPNTGCLRDHSCESSEAVDEFIRQRERDYTPDPIQQRKPP